jgi:hypothetical protein
MVASTAGSSIHYDSRSTCMTPSTGCAIAIHSKASRSTGKERDTESGNDYFDARYFGSSMGRVAQVPGCCKLSHRKWVAGGPGAAVEE